MEALTNATAHDHASEKSVVDRFSNTCQAHKWFCEWLERRIESCGRTTEVTFKPIHLRKLNDTEGVYDAALAAMEESAAGGEESGVTLFLSPGTPVMAFVWALAALNYPRVKKRLISSSRPGMPPEEILLPAEWLEWNGRRTRSSESVHHDFDMCFHLFGDQKLPSYWGVTQYASRYHIFVTSDNYRPEVIRPFLGGAKPLVLRVNAYDPEDVRRKILAALDESKAPSSARIGFNLTGGTKLMYAGAMAACRKVNGTPFYFNQESNSVIDLLTFERTPIKAIDSVETFLRLHGADAKISCDGKWERVPDIDAPGRTDMTSFLWLHRSEVAGIYKAVTSLIDPRNIPGYNAKRRAREGRAAFTYPEPGKGPGASGIVAASEWDGSAEFSMGQQSFQFDHFPYFAKYIKGGWFEEYVYAQLKPLQDEGLISDLRIGLTLSFDADIPEHETKSGHKIRRHQEVRPLQEFDVMFTDGSRLYIVECKAGSVISDYVVKLAEEVRRYGGIGGRGILACCFPPTEPTVLKRIQDNHGLRIVSGDDIASQIRAIMESDRKAYI